MSEPRMIVKGMIQVAGTTYRIVRLGPGQYAVVRVLDDKAVGKFSLAARLVVEPLGIDPDLMREIARVAVQGAKTSWLGRALVA